VVIDICRTAQGRRLPCRKPMRHNTGEKTLQMMNLLYSFSPIVSYLHAYMLIEWGKGCFDPRTP